MVRMRQGLAVLLLAMAGVVKSEPLPPPASIGLLALPQLFGAQPCAGDQVASLPFFESPEGLQPVGEIVARWDEPRAAGDCVRPDVRVRWFDAPDARPMTTEERAYGKPAAVVTEQRAGWFKILLAERMAWIRPEQGYRFYPLEDLYQEQATYLSLAWDGALCREPGQYRQCPTTVIAPELAPPVEVLASREVDGQTWFRIRFLARGGCGEGDEILPRSEGWVPAYGRENKPSIWFYSRGC